MGAASLAWFLLRVIPKPIRATYPCQQAAFPLASACVLWLLGLQACLTARFGIQGRKLRHAMLGIGVLFATGLAAWGLGVAAKYLAQPPSAWQPSEGANAPLGVARGIHPGRVVWTHDPSVATWNADSFASYIDDKSTSVGGAEPLLSQTIQRLTDQGTDAAAWDALFRSFNQRRGNGDIGYAASARKIIAVKINQNENPWDLPQAVKRRVLERALARPWSRYPDFDPHELLEALARFSGWRADGILAGNGSNEMIEALLLVTVGERTPVVIPEPTFTLYALMTTILGGEPVRVRLGSQLRYDVDALLAARRSSGAAMLEDLASVVPVRTTTARLFSPGQRLHEPVQELAPFVELPRPEPLVLSVRPVVVHVRKDPVDAVGRDARVAEHEPVGRAGGHRHPQSRLRELARRDGGGR